MKCLPAFACLATLLCFASNAHASAAFYVRPSVQYAKIYLDDDLTSSGKLGCGIAAGCALGSQQSFNLELEATLIPELEAHRVKGYSGYTETLHETIDLNQYLFAFKYTFLSKDSAVRILIGPTAGWWTAKGNDVVSSTYSYSTYVSPQATYRVSESGIIWGPVVGAIIKVNDHAKVEVAYRHLWMLGADSSSSSSYSASFVGHLTRQFYVSFKYLF